MGTYDQVFDFETDADPDRAFAALRTAVENMDGGHLGDTDESARELTFSTGVTMTSWGEELQAAVTSSATGARIEVRGEPKGTLLSTKWGEDIHAQTIEKRLRKAYDEAAS